MKKETSLFVSNSLFGLATLLAIAFFWRLEILAALFVAGIGVGMMIIRTDKSDKVLYGVCALLGTVAEVIAIWFGAWEYATPTLLGVPLWLPFVWGNAALYMKRLDISIWKML